MKKYILSLVLGLFLVACNNKDSIWTNAMSDVDARLYYLEQLCQQMNTNITSLQVIVNSIEIGDYITSVTPINQGGVIIGYTIVFAKSGSITIYNGTDGKDGQDGVDGQDGATPIIGAAQDTMDGLYYWTINGAWLLDADGNKIRVTGNDGQDGQDGSDGQNGVTPQLKIEDGMWYVSYDGGSTWVLAGQATGDTGATGPAGPTGPAGQNGQNGDSMFQSVTQDANYVYFTLADGTVITIRKSGGGSANVQIIDGAIMAEFSVSPTKKVYFSQGNLQYWNNAWRFAVNQYDIVGNANINRSNFNEYQCDNWIDLFAYGTSGCNGGRGSCFYSDNLNTVAFPRSGSSSCDMVDSLSKYDWGVHNSILNGGNTVGQWRTLTAAEWWYLVRSRGTNKSLVATINNTTGYILVPDSSSVLLDSLLSDSYAESQASDYGVIMNSTTWLNWQKEGCVFLPNAGNMMYNNIWSNAPLYYWSSSTSLETGIGWRAKACSDVVFDLSNTTITQCYGYCEGYAFAVRLVKDIPTE